MVAAVCGEIEKTQFGAAQGAEYRGYAAGSRHLVAHGGVADMCILGEPTESKLVLGHFGSLWLRITTQGPFVHTAFSEGKRDQNSIVRMREVFDAVLEWIPSWEDDPENAYRGARAIVNVGAIEGGFGWRVSRTPHRTDLFLDVRVPPTKVWREYQPDEGVLGIIAANTRTPDRVLGDLRAQRSALRVGELRLQELVARYGRDTVFAGMDEIIRRVTAETGMAVIVVGGVAVVLASLWLAGRLLAEIAIKPTTYRLPGDSATGVLYFSPSQGYTSIYASSLDGGKARVLVKGEQSEQFESFHVFDSRMDVNSAGVAAFSSRFFDRDAVFFWDLRRRAVVGRYQFTELVSILPNVQHDVYKLKISTGARWTFLSDEGLEVQRHFDINEYTDTHHDNAGVPHTLILSPGLVVEKVYVGYWFWGRPAPEQLWVDLGELHELRKEDFDPTVPTARADIPGVVYYAANGMSESALIFLVPAGTPSRSSAPSAGCPSRWVSSTWPPGCG